MISKSKRMRYRWICIEGDLVAHSKDMKLKFKEIPIVRSVYTPTTVNLMVYRGLHLEVLRQVYHYFYIKKLDLIKYRVTLRHNYKKPFINV